MSKVPALAYRKMAIATAVALNGEQLCEFTEDDRNLSVVELKTAIETRAKIPAAEQDLLIDGKALDDGAAKPLSEAAAGCVVSVALKALDDAKVLKIHSAVRWGKPIEEIETVLKELGVSMASAVSCVDPKNGNLALNISSQNGHIDLTRSLLDNKANVNGQNGNGQTPLHMSVAYDFYYQTLLLMERGADKDLKNKEGHAAIVGNDGANTGANAWDNPVTILKASTTAEQFKAALAAIDALEDKSIIDKASLVQTGMMKKKQAKDAWDQARFMEVVKSLP